MKSVFMPLKKQYFEEFRLGLSETEYRRDGGRFRKEMFPVGRRVILSCGYSGDRLEAIVTACESIGSDDVKGTDGIAVRELYGDGVRLIAIRLAVTRKQIAA